MKTRSLLYALMLLVPACAVALVAVDVAALAPLAQDIVVTGHDRAEIGFLVFANILACRALAGLDQDASPDVVLAHAKVVARLREGLRALKAEGGGSSTFAPRALLMGEPDMGTTLVLAGTFAAMLWLGGLPIWIVGVFSVAGSALTALLIFIEPYRWTRFKTYLDPWVDERGKGYQLTQSLIAFGRGDWWGVGLGNSIQKHFYLPEVHTDFIFAVFSEEFGLFGNIILATTPLGSDSDRYGRVFITGYSAMPPEALEDLLKTGVFGWTSPDTAPALFSTEESTGAYWMDLLGINQLLVQKGEQLAWLQAALPADWGSEDPLEQPVPPGTTASGLRHLDSGWGEAVGRLLREEESPRWVLLLSGSLINLFDRSTFAQGRWLGVDLDDAFGRKEAASFDAIAALLDALGVPRWGVADHEADDDGEGDDEQSGSYQVAGTEHTYVVTGLNNGLPYTFTITAKSAGGNGLPSTSVTATPFAPPSAPKSVTAVRDRNGISVRWKKPDDNGGSKVSKWILECVDGANSSVKVRKAFNEGEDGEEMPMGDIEEGSGEMCGKCGCSCEDSDNYCRECGEDLNKEMPNPDKDKEGKGDIDTKAVAKQEYGGDNGGSNEEEIKNVERLKEFSKKK